MSQPVIMKVVRFEIEEGANSMSKYPKRTPLEAIRVFCVECQGGSFQAVTDCVDSQCPFFLYRHGVSLAKGQHSPVRACRKYCFENCLPGSGPDEIRNCCGDEGLLGPCPVFPFRMGRNPNISDATRESRRRAALERGPVGIIAAQNSRIHGPTQPSESTKTARGEL